MRILDQDALFTFAALAYGTLAAYFWRTRWHPESPNVGNALSVAERGAIAFAFAAHGLGLYLAVFSGEEMRFSFALAASVMMWLACVFYWIEGLRIRLESIQPLVLAPAALAALLPLLFEKSHLITHAGNLSFRLHFAAAMLAYSLFLLAFLQAILLRFAEQKLHRHDFNRGMTALPPIMALENMLFRMISVGFVLLSFALVSGAVFSGSVHGQAWRLDHKTVFALLSWVIFAALLAGRRLAGWRGRVAQYWLIAGFIALMLAYVGSRFVAEVLLGR